MTKELELCYASLEKALHDMIVEKAEDELAKQHINKDIEDAVMNGLDD